MTLPDTASVETRAKADQLDEAVGRFLTRWAPADRIQEFSFDLKRLNQAACDFFAACLKDGGML
jgi:hypothetical protein